MPGLPRSPEPDFNSIKVRLEHLADLRLRKILSNFNSIKVRLELMDFGEDYTVLPFQFHKGTIRTPGDKVSCSLKQYFNSIKVRLERVVQPLLSQYLQPFQFHKGTIRTKVKPLLF